MKAVVHDAYGSADVIDLENIDEPQISDNEVLVRVRAASINPYDWHNVTGLPYVMRVQSGVRKPRSCRLGADLAGHVEVVGKDVTRFQTGDEVFGDLSASGDGAFAEHAAVPERALVSKPTNLTFEEAAAVPMAGLTALQALRNHGRLQQGQHVLINGASGGVGTFAVQLGKSFGAEVTGVCSTSNGALVRSIGADHVIDYTSEDFTRLPARFDVILDLVGNRSASSCRRVLSRNGRYVASFGRPENRWLGPIGQLLRLILVSPFVSQKMITFVTKPNAADLAVLKELIEAGDVTPVIDRTYQLSEMREAVRYLGQGHARGKIVIAV